jgi:hypothetical protein
MDLSLQHLLQHADEEEDMLNMIASGDESRVHHYQPESNHFGGKCFAGDEEIETEVQKWLRQKSKNFILQVSTNC